MAYKETEARELIISAVHRLTEAGLVARTWGNVSARVSEEQFVITPSGLGYEHMQPEDLGLVNISDLSYEGERKPSSEKGIHADAYRLRPEVNFVIHTHQDKASVYGIRGWALSGFSDPVLGKRVPCAAYGLPSTDKLRQAVADQLSSNPSAQAILMRGHGALYWRKAAAMLATVLAGVVLLYGANLAVSSAVLGLGDPARPIQTIPSMQSCPVPLTVFGWLLCFLGEKLLWGWAVGALFFLLCTTTGRAWAAFLLAGGGAGLALLLGSRGSLWPRLLSLSRAAEVEESWRGCIYLNFFGLPLRQTALLPAMLLLLTVGGCLGGAVVFCRTQAVQPVRQRRGLPLPRLRHTVLLAYEARKLLLTGGALLVLAVFVLVQIGSYRDFRAYFNADEWFYRAYSEKLAGEPTPEKNAYLASETARFAELQNELADYARITEGNEDALQFMARDVLSALRAQDGFEKAKQQYEQLQPGQSYVYETGYNVLLGYFGVQKDLLDLAKLFFFLTVALSAVFAMEQETGVAVLQTAAGANGRVLRRKLLLTAVLVLLMVTAAFLPRLLAVRGAYGLPEWGAQANSLPQLSGVPAGWRIRTVLGLRALVHVLLGAGGAAVILLLSRKTRSTIQTMLIAAGILVVPTVAAALLW